MKKQYQKRQFLFHFLIKWNSIKLTIQIFKAYNKIKNSDYERKKYEQKNCSCESCVY